MSLSKSNLYSRRIVAFVDILGFKSLIDESLESEEMAKHIHNALKRILQVKRDNEDAEGLISLKKFGVEVTTFSDSAVISYPIDFEGGLFHVLLDIIHLQQALIYDGVLIRGGITIGDLYHDGEIVYGPAMNEAYRLESQYADQPRIIISRQHLLSGIRETVSSQNGLMYEVKYIEGLVRQDKDGFYFLDILNQSQEISDDGTDYYCWLWTLRKIIVRGLQRNFQNRRVYGKYVWLKKYFNTVVTDEKLYFSVPDVEEREQMEFRKKYFELKIRKKDYYV